MVLRSITLRALAMASPESSSLQNCAFCSIIKEDEPGKLIYQFLSKRQMLSAATLSSSGLGTKWLLGWKVDADLSLLRHIPKFDDMVVAFCDIKPAAEHHYLVIPRNHLPNPRDLDSSHKSLVEHMIKVGNDILTEKAVDLNNSRFGFHWPPFNTISHLHLHAIAPVDKMNFMSRLIFKPGSYWFVSPEYVLSRL